MQLAAAAILPLPAIAASECSTPIATITSVQGTVEVQTQPGGGWLAAKLDQVLCGGEQVRTGPYSRAKRAEIDPQSSQSAPN